MMSLGSELVFVRKRHRKLKYSVREQRGDSVQQESAEANASMSGQVKLIVKHYSTASVRPSTPTTSSPTIALMTEGDSTCHLDDKEEGGAGEGEAQRGDDFRRSGQECRLEIVHERDLAGGIREDERFPEETRPSEIDESVLRSGNHDCSLEIRREDGFRVQNGPNSPN
jgi:hypothetical protein